MTFFGEETVWSLLAATTCNYGGSAFGAIAAFSAFGTFAALSSLSNPEPRLLAPNIFPTLALP